ncbi:MAG TPA: metal ABC transporter substrate-binding protein [Acidimicrobiales bacterium]
MAWPRRLRISLLGVGVVLALGACSSTRSTIGGDGGTANGSAKVKVAATTTQVADFARVIGGDCVEVYGILKPNVDPHDYEPSPADVNALAEAEVIIKNGVDLEKWLEPTLASASSAGIVVDTSAGVTIRHGDGAETAGDPHIWHDPHNAKIMATTIEQALTSARPTCQAEFAANLADYSTKLDALDRAIVSSIATLTNKKLVTNHDAFGYYVDRYGLDFVGSIIPSFDSSAELSANQLADLVTAIRAQGVKAVFSETSLPAKTADAIAGEAGVKVVEGDDALYGDTLGPAGSPGDTYLDMMRHNTETIVTNLR